MDPSKAVLLTATAALLAMAGASPATATEGAAPEAAAAAAPAPAPSDKAPPVMRVQVGDHGGHSRMTMSGDGVQPQIEMEACGARIVTPIRARWPLTRLRNTKTQRLSGYQAAEDGHSLSLRWPCGARVTVRQEKAAVVLDVADPPVPSRKPGSPPPDPVVAAAPQPAPPPVPEPAAPSPEPAPPFSLIGTAQAKPLPETAALPQAQPLPPAPAPAPAPQSEKQPEKQPEKAAAKTAPAKAMPAARVPDPLEATVRQNVEETLRRLDPSAARPGTVAAPAKPSPANPSPAKPLAAEPELPPIRPFDLAAWGGTDFAQRKRALESAIADSGEGRAGVDALIAMARFALAHAMPEEGRAALDAAEIRRPAPDQRYELRLLGDAFRALDGTAEPDDSLFVRTPAGAAPDHHVWRSATLAPTRWAAAREGLPIALKRLLSYPADLRGRLLTLLAEAAGNAPGGGDGAALNMIVMEMITLDGPGSADGRLDYFRGRLAELRKAPEAALEHYVHAAGLPTPYGHRARVRSIELRLASGALTDAGAIAELETLRYAWRGDDVETDALAALGEAYTRVGRTDAAFDIFGLLGRRFGDTARGRTAMGAGHRLLIAVTDRLEQTPPGALDALALQVRHGRAVARMDDEAGTQQRRLARLLARDGFTVEAARLLHGLAEGARGARRAEIGIELARVLLDAGRGAEALDVLNRTANLESVDAKTGAALAERRALLRAEAFAADGDAMRAIDALRGLSGAPAARMRAQTLFRAGEWAAARAAFADILKQPGEPDPDDVALHALSAFRAGEAGAVNAAAERHRARLAGTRWAGLLDALVEPPAEDKPLSAAEVSRQLAAAGTLDGVMRRWRTAR